MSPEGGAEPAAGSIGLERGAGPEPRPRWLVVRAPRGEDLARMETLLEGARLSTVCQSARCPNIGECFGRGTVTFMILGSVCTRGCRFCAVDKGKPAAVDPSEPLAVAGVAAKLGLKHVVVTSVTRDDLPDGGAAHFARTIRELESALPHSSVEVLVPDFPGSKEALSLVMEAGPDLLNHNLETVPRLYPIVRPKASYRRSLDLLRWAKEMNGRVLTKSGLMLGLGETREEVIGVMSDLREVQCDLLTLGQYLPPTRSHVPLKEYVVPAVFHEYAEVGEKLGFLHVASGPLVLSSYHAGDLARSALRERILACL